MTLLLVAFLALLSSSCTGPGSGTKEEENMYRALKEVEPAVTSRYDQAPPNGPEHLA